MKELKNVIYVDSVKATIERYKKATAETSSAYTTQELNAQVFVFNYLHTKHVIYNVTTLLFI